ncbi:MAG: autotransporter outer membrane beta-barrel domain-containing protein, partial [Gammaproteobacteria bacterium]|nr:autotransporter outer membrane beta-barrel domain-containing protein [Gammaproteobacteria bacterium]
IINNGSIDVSASDLQSGCASANGCGDLSGAQDTLWAIGIQTGDGDDVVANYGAISAVIFENNVGTSHVGIDLGLGNDALTLGGISSVFGSIDLGDGDDWLTLTGTPTAMETGVGIFELQAGAGMDSLLLLGAGEFTSSLISFENATKSGEGTYSLTQPLATLNSLTIDGGVLSLSSDYTFDGAGFFSTYIHSDGDEGLLDVIGSVFANGAITVERRGESYIADRTSFTIVSATTGVVDEFTDVTLPEARPLLSFELQQEDNLIKIVAVAPAFSTVTSNSSYSEVGDNVFGLTGVAVGDFSKQLGTLQSMDSGFDRALASLSPDSYESLTSNTLALGHQTTQLLRTHLGNARAVRRGTKAPYAAYEPVVLAYNAGEFRTNGAATQSYMMGQTGPIRDDDPELTGVDSGGSRRLMTQTWASAFGASGDYDAVDGLTEYDHDSAGFTVGADHLYGEDVIAGIMINYSETDIDQLQASAIGDIYSWSAGLYATRFWDDSYLEGGITFTDQTFKNWRLLEIGADERWAMSEHDGNTWMAFVGAGRELNFGTWQMEPYGTLYYFDIEEDAFAETGVDSLNLVFEKKSTDVLLGEIGTTFVRLQDVRSGVIDWHASLAYNHDFDIDDGSIAYAYSGQPGSVLRIDDRNITAGSAVIGAGFAYIRKRSALALDYRGQFNSDYRQNIVGLRLAYSF